MARTGVMEYRRNRSYVPNRSQLLLLIAFIIQGYVAYRYGVRSAKNDNHNPKILSPTLVPQKPLSNAAALADTPTIWSPTTTISAASSSSKFILGSMNDKPNSYDLLVISNKLRYAATHNYDIVWDFDKSSSSNSNSEPSYSKDWDRLTTMAKIIQNKLAGQNSYEWIWWTDYDLIVTNFSIPLDSVVREALEQQQQQQQHVEEDVTRREEIDLIMTPDCFPVNSGSLLVRTSAWSLEWIGEMWRQRLVVSEEDGRWRSLQDCLGDMYKSNTLSLQHKSIFIQQHKMNAFPEEIHCHQDGRAWQKGDFAIHMAGAWAHVKWADDPTGWLLRKYVNEVV